MNIKDYLEYQMEKTAVIRNFFRNVTGRNLKEAVKKRTSLQKEVSLGESRFKELNKKNPYGEPNLKSEEGRLMHDLALERGFMMGDIPKRRVLKKALASIESGATKKSVIDSLTNYALVPEQAAQIRKYFLEQPSLKEALKRELKGVTEQANKDKANIKNLALKLKPIRDARLQNKRAWEKAKREESGLVGKIKELNTMRGLEETARKAQKRDRLIAGGVTATIPTVGAIKMYSSRK